MSADQTDKPPSYYELLDVAPGASDADVKRAYRRLALEHHPDRTLSHISDRRIAELRFRLINEAYAHLKTKERRDLYDHTLRGRNDNTLQNSSLWTIVAGLFKNTKTSS